MSALTWPEAIVVGAFQGVAELFPVSSLGHSVLIPGLIGGRWATDLNVTAKDSPYLAFIVGLHVATAIALIAYFWRDWIRIIGGFLTSVRDRRVETADQRLAWLLILATIPVGIVGVAGDHFFREHLATPQKTAIFLAINGLVLFAVEAMKGTPKAGFEGGGGHGGPESDARLAKQPVWQAVTIGAAQIFALLPGISRSGSTIVAGLRFGLDHEDAARFAFLLATPVILAAGAFKLPELAGTQGHGIIPQVVVGSILSGVGAYIALAFLTRFFKTGSLRPFGVYCLVAGIGSAIYLAAK